MHPPILATGETSQSFLKKPGLFLAALFITFCALSTGSIAPAIAEPVPSSQAAVLNVPSEAELSKLGFAFVRQSHGIVEYKLIANGLKVILKENHSAPVASSVLVYHVGSRNEAVGYTGATHFLEHMMFKRTQKRDAAALLSAIGAESNATTSKDRTLYYEVVGTDKLELVLSIEADRMRNLIFTQENHDSEMTVVRNEMERGNNSPGHLLYTEMSATAFREHPYHHPVIGWRSDVEGVPLTRLKQFYDDFYWPNNASLIITGDIEPSKTLTLIARQFGAVPASPKPIPEVYTVEPAQTGERRFELHHPGGLERVNIAFHIPQAANADTYPLHAIEQILGGSSPSSRLYRSLVETGLATSVGAGAMESHDPDLFLLRATVAPGVKPAAVEKALLAELTKLASQPVADEELQRVKTANHKATLLQMSDPSVVGQLLAEAEAVNDWTYYDNFESNLEAVKAADIQRTAAKYFRKDNRTVGIYFPDAVVGAPEQDSAKEQPAAENHGKVSRQLDGKDMDEIRAALQTRPVHGNFASQVRKTVLPNGLTVLVMPNSGTGTVAISGRIKAGNYYNFTSNQTLPTVVAGMLTKGSNKFSKVELGRILDKMGSDLSFSCELFNVSFDSEIVASDFSTYLDVLADTVRHPLFNAGQLSLLKKSYAAALVQSADKPESVASTKLAQSLYKPGSLYYEEDTQKQLIGLQALTVKDLKQYHRSLYDPRSMTITIVGDINPDLAVKLIEERFGNWVGSNKPVKPVVSEAITLPKASRLEFPLAGKANVDIQFGQPSALDRKSPDFMAAFIANEILGGDTLTSRLGKAVRVENGLTYGIYSYFTGDLAGGAPWSLELSVNPANVDRAVSLVNDILRTYTQSGITDDELLFQVGKNEGQYYVEMRSSSQIASRLAHYDTVGLPVSEIDNFGEKLRALTKEQVNGAIATHLHPNNMVTVIAGTPGKH